MVAFSYATPERRINAEPCLPHPVLNNEPEKPPLLPARAALMALLPWPGDVVPIDPALEAVEQHRPDPYAEIVNAINEGLMVAEFAPPPQGATLRSIILRRL